VTCVPVMTAIRTFREVGLSAVTAASAIPPLARPERDVMALRPSWSFLKAVLSQSQLAAIEARWTERAATGLCES
jgi:hypothetical protein